MSLIYPDDAFRRYGPPPIAVHDATGRRLLYVVGCDPVTGEVIQNLSPAAWAALCLLLLGGPRRILWAISRSMGVAAEPGELVQRHYFAPAPLTISRVSIAADDDG
jgi:hypothetical protein